MNQREQILNYIKEFGSITPLEAFADCGIEFDIETVKSKNRFNKTVHYAKYRLRGVK